VKNFQPQKGAEGAKVGNKEGRNFRNEEREIRAFLKFLPSSFNPPLFIFLRLSAPFCG